MNSDSKNLWQGAERLSKELTLHCLLDGTILGANAVWLEVLGWDASEVQGKKYFDLVHAEDSEKTRQAVGRMAAGSAPAEFCNRVRHKDDSYRWISWTAAAHETILYAAGQDISAQKDAETALLESQDTLCQLQKMDSISRMSGAIAHDFNNLLQGIVSSLELVRKLNATGRGAETERFMIKALESAQRVGKLNQRLLGFSRRQPANPKPGDLNEAIVGIEDLLRSSLPSSIRLDLDLSTHLWQTTCDWNQLEIAIINLASNARDALPDGGIIKIQTSNISADTPGSFSQFDRTPGEYVCFDVTDSGTGMSQQTIHRAFDPGFTTKPKGQNFGLGLTMVRKFAREHKGEVRIQSEIGHGSTVTVLLPRYQSTDPKAGAL